MSASEKILWVVNYNSLQEFVDLAKKTQRYGCGYPDR